jgi:hypothetical protein
MAFQAIVRNDKRIAEPTSSSRENMAAHSRLDSSDLVRATILLALHGDGVQIRD